MTTRTGKIARLPREIRDELNRRLDDGESGTSVVAWLNAQPDVQAVPAASFAARPISEQNLSEWKQGGFQDWLHLQETRHLVRSLTEESSALSQDSADPVSTLLSAPLAAALARCLRSFSDAASDDPASQRTLLAVARELSWLRRSDQAEQLLRMKREAWQAKKDEKAAEESRKKAPLTKGLTPELMAEIERDLDLL